MKKALIASAALATLLLAAGTSLAALCKNCQDMMFIMSVGSCSQCGAQTSSGAFKYCGACSAKLGVCHACGAKLADAKVPATGPATSTAPSTQPSTGPATRPTPRPRPIGGLREIELTQ